MIEDISFEVASSQSVEALLKFGKLIDKPPHVNITAAKSWVMKVLDAQKPPFPSSSHGLGRMCENPTVPDYSAGSPGG